MKTVFTMGFFERRDSFWMGQEEPAMTVTKDQRDAALKAWGAAADKARANDAWAKNHPNLAQDLGPDFQRYQELVHNLAYLAGNSANAYAKFASTDPALWLTITAQEWNDADTWAAMEDELYGITLRHPTTGVAAKPAVPGAKPGAPAPKPGGIGTTELLVGGAAVVGIGLLVASL